MAINAGDLVINVRANATQFRQAMGQTVAAVAQASQQLDTFAKKTEKLGGTGFGGFFDPSGQAKGFIDTASAMGIYESEVNSLVSTLSGFSATLGRINQPLFQLRQNMVATGNATTGAAVAIRDGGATLGDFARSTGNVSSATTLVATGFGNLVSRSNVLSSVLRQLNLINFNVFASLSSWNTLDVLAGPGRLVQVFDRLKVAIFGGAAPLRALQFFTNLLIPGVQALGIALLRLAESQTLAAQAALAAEGPAQRNVQLTQAQIAANAQFGANVLKLADDLKLLGSSWTPKPILIFANAIKSAYRSIVGLPNAIRQSSFGKFISREAAIAKQSLQGVENPVQKIGIVLNRAGILARNFALNLAKIAIVGTAATAIAAINVSLVQLTRVLGIAVRGMLSLASSFARIVASPIVGAFRAAGSAVGQLAQNLGLAKSKSDQLAGSAGKAANAMKGVGQQSRAAQGFIFGLSGLGPGITLLAQGGVQMAGAFGLVSTALSSIEQAANFEQIQNSFETLVGSAEKARATVKDLISFSDITPFEPGPIVEAGKALITAGVATEDLRAKLKSIGDIAAGTGQPVEELAQIYARVRNENRLTGEVLSRLGDRGIPVAKELAKAYNTTEAGVRDLAEKGKIGIDALDFAFANLSGEGGKFEDLMKKQSTTVGGLFSTLAGRIKSSSIEIGLAFFDAFNIRGALSGLIDAASLFQTNFIPTVKASLSTFGTVVTGIAGPVFDWIRANVQLIGDVFQAGFSFARDVVVSAFDIIATAASQAFSFISSSLFSVFGDGATSAFTDFASLAQTALLTIQFGFENWRDVAALAVLKVGLGIVTFANQIVYFFGTVVPAYLVFVRDNWRDIWTDVVNFTSTVLSNLYQNITSFFENVTNFIASGGTAEWTFDWTPLTTGFESAIKQLPVIADREIGGLEASLTQQVNGLQGALSEGLTKYIAERKKALDTPAKDKIVPPEAPILPEQAKAPGGVPALLEGRGGAGGGGGAGTPDLLGAIEQGSRESFKAIAEARRAQSGKDTPAEKQLFVTKEMLKALRAIAKSAEDKRGKIKEAAL